MCFVQRTGATVNIMEKKSRVQKDGHNSEYRRNRRLKNRN